MAAPKSLSPIDRLMERASEALEANRYFEAERLCARGLARAHVRRDYERMARILMPLQEARRQKRLAAIDSGRSVVRDTLKDGHTRIDPGCCLIQPPLIAADTRNFREEVDARGVPVLALTREPMTRDGKWPIVAVGCGGTLSIRTRVDPPRRLSRVESSPTKDNFAPGSKPPSVQWFVAAAEALGDAAIARLQAEDPAAWQVDDLTEFLDAFPDHEKLHQRLDDACRRALVEPAPLRPRRRPLINDPYSF